MSNEQTHGEEKAPRGQGQGPVGLDKQIERFANRHDSREELRISGDLRGSKARSAAEKFITRFTSGIIYVCLILVCLLVGPIATTLLISAMAWLCCSEFFRIVRMSGRKPNEVVGLSAAVLFPLAAGFLGLRGIVALLILVVIAIACWYVFAPFANIADVSVTVFGPVYTSILFCGIVFIRQFDPGFPGALLTFGVLGSIWVNDSFAYLSGRAFGRHKLVPRISPNKTWEGFFGGLFGSLLVWFIMSLIPMLKVSLPLALVSGIVVGLMSVVGDLFESRLKRGAGVKDSGNLLPGHGGLLDRSDSILFGGMVAYILLVLGGVL